MTVSAQGVGAKRGLKGFFYSRLSKPKEPFKFMAPNFPLYGVGHKALKSVASFSDMPAPLGAQRDFFNKLGGEVRLPRVWCVQSNPAHQPQRERLSGKTDVSAKLGGCFTSHQFEGHICPSAESK